MVCWRTRDLFVQVVRLILARHPDPLSFAAEPKHGGTPQIVSVSEQMFLDWLDCETAFADHDTGRNVIQPTARIAGLLSCSQRTVQRCRRVARNLGIYVTVLEGRQLTFEERLEAWAVESQQRGLTNESAFVIPLWIIPDLIAEDLGLSTTSESSPVKGNANVSPPVGTTCGSALQVSGGPCSSRRAQVQVQGRFSPSATAQPARTGRAPTPRVDQDRPGKLRLCPRRRHRGDRLAEELLKSGFVPWLPPELHPRRLGPILARYEDTWTPAQIAGAINAKRKRLGHRCPIRVRRTPWGLLRWMLSDIDPVNDHPGFHPDTPAQRLDQEITAGTYAIAGHEGVARAAQTVRDQIRPTKGAVR